MYARQKQDSNRKIYSDYINTIEESPVLASILEQCQKEAPEVVSQIQNDWQDKVAQEVSSIASLNPFLPDLVIGEEISAAEAALHRDGLRGVDCRPKVFDGISKSWKLCDSGSMVTVIKKGPNDKPDPTRFLKAVNGSKIECYGHKEVEIRLNRKSYVIKAVIADVSQDILGWDFLSKYKLNWQWTEFGDLYLVDPKAKTKNLVKFVTLPASSSKKLALLDSPQLSDEAVISAISEFEVASMKALGGESEVNQIKPKYQKLLDKYPSILIPSFKELSTKHNVTHRIPTGSASPFKAKVRPLLENSEKAIKGREAWLQMEKLGVIEKVDPKNYTAWAAALHLVPKPDNTMRPTTDFRQLNARTTPEAYPLPNLKSFTEKLKGSTIFSKIDLVHAFHNVLIHPSDVEKTATVTPWGVFVYKRLAFGLSGGPSTFMKLIDSVLSGIDGIYTYLDDILVHASNEKRHYEILDEVFQRLTENGLAIKLSKCEFGKKEVEYVGYKVTKDGITPLKAKVDAIVGMQPPKSQKDLLHFLGALGYYRTSLKGVVKQGKFRNPAEVLQVLFNLATCKLPVKTKLPDIWNQNTKMNEAFEDAKQMLINSVLLAHPDPGAKLALCTDASDFAIGGALEQLGPDGKYHPLGFFSRHLGPDKQKWSTYRKELYACVQSLRHFLPQFYGRHITIYSDHLPLTKSFESETLQNNDPVAQRQLVEIGMFTKDVKYLKAKHNHFADFLSRKTPEALIGEAYKLERSKADQNIAKGEDVDYTNFDKVAAVSEFLKINTLEPADIAKAQESCSEVENCKKGNHSTSLAFDTVSIDGIPIFCEVSGVNPRPVVPERLRSLIISSYHDIDHPGQAESVRRAASQYFWASLKKDMSNYVATCHPCLSTKQNKLKTPHVGHFPVPKKRFSHIHVDICGPLPPSRGYKFLLTVVCRSTRFVDAIPMVDATTQSCAEALLHSWTARHGICAEMTSDNGVEFVSAVWKAMQAKLGVKLNFTPTYTPQANGLIERQHSTIKTSLKAAMVQMGDKYQDRWYDYLPWILLMKRSSFQKELKCSPAMLTYGMNLAIPGDLLRDPGDPHSEPELEELVKFMQKTNNNQPIPTAVPKQNIVPEPSNKITHVYTKEHNTTGLQSPFSGPFRIVSRPSRSTVKICVGLTAKGEERHETRHWKDLKVAQMRSGAPEGQRPQRGRPRKDTENNKSGSESDRKTNVIQEEEASSKQTSTKSTNENSNVGGKPVRSTQNPKPNYVDSISTSLPWNPAPFSASIDEISELNRRIGA